MTMRIKNISNQVIGIVTKDANGYHQTDLLVGEEIEVSRLGEQLIQLCDPYKRILQIIKED